MDVVPIGTPVLGITSLWSTLVTSLALLVQQEKPLLGGQKQSTNTRVSLWVRLLRKINLPSLGVFPLLGIPGGGLFEFK